MWPSLFSSLVRAPALCTVACIGLFPLYLHLLRFLTDEMGLSERMVFVVGTSLVHTATYLLCNGTFALWDAYGLFEQYKLDRKPSQQPSKALLNKTLREAAMGQTVIGPLTLYLLYPAFKYFGMPAMDAALPPPSALYGFFVACYLCNDIMFYFSHRLFHGKAIYKHIHKQHHNYVGTIGFAAEYAHPLETIFSNQLPTVAGCFFFGAHQWIFWFWLLVRLQQTYEVHSGYAFVGTWPHKLGLTNGSGAVWHDFHHTTNRGNFGTGYLDYLFGTMDAFVAVGGEAGYIALKNAET